MAQFVPTHSQAALDVVATERDRVAAEQDAFGTFHDRIEALDAARASSAGDSGQQTGALLRGMPALKKSLQRAREAYRETVMSVPHYEDDYDESLAEHLAAEFSPAVATAVTTTDALTPQLRERLLVESHRASDLRANLLTALTQERTRLQTAVERMTALRPDLDGLATSTLRTMTSAEFAETREEVLTAEHRCNDLAADRQATLRTARIPGPRQGDLSLEEYLYQSLSVTHPVLADLAELGDTLRTARCRIDRVHDALACDRSEASRRVS